ncbi:MAG: reverse transcriptase domain-containing protein [Candidatus Poseidoniaceae archaeon]
MSDEFWCFTSQYSSLQHDNTVNRRTGKIPSMVWLGKTIKESKLQPFGCRAKIISTTDAGRALNPRTSGDPRLPQADPHHQVVTPATAAESIAPGVEFDCRFVGYGNDPAVVLVYQPGSKSHKIRRVHHVILDPYGLSTNPRRKLLPHEHLLRAVHSNLFLPPGVPRRSWHVEITPSDLDVVSSPFDPQHCESFTVTLPPQGQSIGLTFTTDEDYMLPVLHRIHPDYDIFDEIPQRHNFGQSWVIAIDDNKPLTSTGAVEDLKHLQLPNDHRQITIQFCKIVHPERFTDYEGFRAVFDSMIGLRFAHIAHLTEPPLAPRSFWECLDTEHRDLWIKATGNQYHKNQLINLCSAPEPIENVPPNRKVLPVVLAPKIKRRGDNLYEFVTRMCANGSNQEQGIDFEHSWSPTVSAIALRLTLYLAAYWGLTIAILDIVNCFQHTLLEEKDCLIIHAPFNYINWFRHNFPKHKITPSPSGKYVLQIMGKGIQGDKGVGRRWYLLLRKILIQFGFHQCLPEPALFRYSSGSRQHIVNISTDDLLCAFSHDDLFTSLRDHLSRMFDLTTKTGTQLEYLNFRIIQSPHGISFDQSTHILKTIINKFFPPATTDRLKTVHTPFRTDSAYETELFEDLPADKSQLAALIKRYSGTFPEILGQLMHVYVWSRPELGFGLTRLSRYTQGPTAAAFAGLYRVIRFLATHPHRPIIYPRRIIDGFHTLRIDFDPPKFESIELPNSMICLVDSDHARDHETRRSVESVLLLLGGCAFDWKQAQCRIIALHSTDSETRGAFTAAKRTIHAQDIASFLGFPTPSIRPVPLYIDSQPCIDILNANAVTSRVKHIAVPIHFIHQLIFDGRISIRKIGTHLNLADSGTKPNSAPVLFRHFDHIHGVRFYPPSGSDHFRLLELHRFVQSPFSKSSKSSKTT